MSADAVKKARRLKRVINFFVVILMFALYSLNYLWLFEYRVRDAVIQNPGVLHPDIFVIGIDEHALATFGPFQQWPRSLLAEAIQILNTYPEARPAVIGIDIMYTEPGLDYELDRPLVEAAQSAGNLVLAAAVDMGIDPTQGLDPVPLSLQRPFDSLLPYVDYGLVNAIFDRDGVIRNAPLHVVFDDRTLYSFPVAVASMYQGYTPSFAQTHSETFIRYTGLPGNPGDFFMFSFADIFEDFFDPSWLDGAIVLIGPYATGMMDHYAVPIYHGIAMYGVEIHANVIQAILDGNFTQLAPYWVNLSLLTILLVAGMILGEVLDIRWVLAVFLSTAVAYHFTALWLLEQGWVMPILSPPLTLFIVFFYQLIYSYILSSMERSRIRGVLNKYVDPKLVDTLIATNDVDSDAVGQKRHIAIMFVDIRGFTTLTEKLQENPGDVVDILNSYLELTSSAVFDNGGSVDKFIGDATMALFNGFVSMDDYVYSAVKAAWNMVEGAEKVNKQLRERLGIEIGFGVGVHCGEAIVGNLGPSFRKDYTAIGDPVNTAARLESNAKSSQVLISEDVYTLIKDRISADFIGEIQMKGKSHPMLIYSLTGVHS